MDLSSSVNDGRALAARIRLSAPVTQRVVICLPRSFELVLSIIGVLSAGCAYVIVDPDFPRARKRAIILDAHPDVILTTSACVEDLPDIGLTWRVDDVRVFESPVDAPTSTPVPSALAYIAYTSGSTGQPKGVMVRHDGLMNVLSDLACRFPHRASDVYLFKTKHTFDIHATEVLGWFFHGGALSILPVGDEGDPRAIAQAIMRHRVTHINFVPMMLELFLQAFTEREIHQYLATLRWVFVGGDALLPRHVKGYQTSGLSAALVNLYGPTECTLWATSQRIDWRQDDGRVSIGRPFNRMRCYVLDEDHCIQPIGMPGELFISGIGVAAGYLNNQAKTAASFVKNPFFNPVVDDPYYEIMYQTGDWACWREDGSLNFIARKDTQIKHRGMRMELGEVESALHDVAGVQQAMCDRVSSQSGADRLVVFYLSAEPLDTATLKSHLSELLPEYMLPAAYVHYAEWPLNSNGKIDRRSLLSSFALLQQPDEVAPSALILSPEQEQLVAIWGALLGLQSVGLDDRFFDVGGDSLSIIKLQHQIQCQLNRDVSITTLFQYPTIRAITAHWHAGTQSVVQANSRAPQTRTSEIAIIGLGINVPGAESVEDFGRYCVRMKRGFIFYDDAAFSAPGNLRRDNTPAGVC